MKSLPKRLEEFHQILGFLVSQLKLEVLVIVLNDLIQGLEAAVVEEATALAAP